MSNANFSILVDFAAGGLVLASVLIVWRRDLRAVCGCWPGRVLRWPRSRYCAASATTTVR